MLRLPEITYPLSVDTIGKVLALGEGIAVHCDTYGCSHRGRLNLVLLARRLGMDHSCLASDLRPHLYCPKCREAGRPDKKLGFTHQVLSDPHSRWPRELKPEPMGERPQQLVGDEVAKDQP